MTNSVKISIPNFNLYSKWKYKPVTHMEGAVKKIDTWVLESPPTTDAKTVKIKYSVPSGAKIKTVRIWAKISSGNTISVCNVNGNSFSVKGNYRKGANVKLTSTSGTLTAVFKYRSSGTLYKDENIHTGVCRFESVYLEITYDSFSEKKKGGTKKKKGLAVPPQSVCIYDQSDGSVYLFDGVTKIQHSASLDLQEEPDNKKKSEYVNNAKNQPDKVSLDVVMSDVYTGGGAIVRKAGSLSSAQSKAFKKTSSSLIQSGRTRSESAYYTLHWLKEQRRKLSVITPQFVHVDMILSSITVNQDDSCPYGWQGQIEFQHAFKAKSVKKKKTKQGGDESDPASPAWQAQIKKKVSG